MNRAQRHIQWVAEIAGRLLALERASRRTLTAGERTDARTWYIAQRLRLERIAAELDLPADTVIACAAILSPATSWHALVVDLPCFLSAAADGEPFPPFATYGRQRILGARCVRERRGLESATGPKIRPFALALAGDASQVVVDRHVVRYSLNLPDRVAMTPCERRAIQDAHRVAGTALGIAPRDLQSLLWVARVGYGGAYTPATAEGSAG